MKKFLRIAGILIALLLLIAIAAPFLINARDFGPMLESNLGKALGREVKVGDLKVAIFSGGITADNLSIADDPAYSRSPFLQAKALTVKVDLWTLIVSRQLHVLGLTIDQPQVTLLQAPNGDWNYSSLGTKSAQQAAPPASAGKSNLDLSVNLVRLTGGRFTLGRTSGHLKPLVLENVNAEVTDFSPATAFPFSFSTDVAGGGSIKLNGKVGPMDPNDTAMTPVSASLSIAKLDLAGSGLNEMAPSVAGLLTFDGSGDSNGKVAEVKGHLKVEQLKLTKNGAKAAKPVEFDFVAEHDFKKRAGVLKQGNIKIGAAPIALTGTYGEQNEAMIVKMNLNGPNMPIPELAEMLPVIGIVLPAGSTLQGGTASAKLAMDGALDRLVTSGTLSVNKTKLSGFDLPQKMASLEKMAGIKSTPDTEIEVFSGNIRMAPEGMSAQQIQLVVPAIGELNGDGTVDPAYALAFKMRATVHTGGMMAVVSNTPIPFTVEGTCAQPVIKPDLKAVVKEEVKSLGSDVEKAAGGLLKGLLGGKKQQ